MRDERLDLAHIRTIEGWPVTLTLVGLSCIATAYGFAIASLWWVSLGIVVLVLPGALLYRRTWRHVRAIGAAAADIQRGDVARGEEAIARVLAQRPFRTTAGGALLQLANAALEAGDLARAAELTRVAVPKLRGPFVRSSPRYDENARIYLEYVLACAGETDEAERVGAAPPHHRAGPHVSALHGVARALTCLRRGRGNAALELVERHRTLVRNTLGAREGALTDAIESLALSAVGSVYRGKSRSIERVVVHPDHRAFLVRVLPECAPLLVNEPDGPA